MSTEGGQWCGDAEGPCCLRSGKRAWREGEGRKGWWLGGGYCTDFVGPLDSSYFALLFRPDSLLASFSRTTIIPSLTHC